jgi:nicotinate phosphoribosyltransferase
MSDPKFSMANGALYTDFYQLTMAQLYFQEDMHDTRARFEHFFRSYPDYGEHQAGYCINAGLNWFLDWLEGLSFEEEELNQLRNHTTREGERQFSDDFLGWLSEQQFDQELRIEAIPEGRVVHPNVPLTVVEGPLALAQIIETPLLNQLNYQTLIATKASRIKLAGEENLLLEFGMRRGHDRGANAGARASLIGGADYSSNTGLSYDLGFDPKGTHAHSLVQAYLAQGKSELDAFRAFAERFPSNCILLIDTIDTLNSGLPNAITVFKELREKGYEPVGVRLDSGDLAHLAVRSARRLNDEGFEDVNIVLSNQLDEQVLRQIINQIHDEASDYGLDPERVVSRLVYGVGTRLITSKGDASLGGVYKLVGLKKDDDWSPVLKISESIEKVPNPGRKSTWRLYDERGKATADLIGTHEESLSAKDPIMLRHPTHSHASRRLESEAVDEYESLHELVLEDGKRSSEENIARARERRKRDLDALDPGVKRIMNPHEYHVSVTPAMWKRKQNLLESYRPNKD